MQCFISSKVSKEINSCEEKEPARRKSFRLHVVCSHKKDTSVCSEGLRSCFGTTTCVDAVCLGKNVSKNSWISVTAWIAHDEIRWFTPALVDEKIVFGTPYTDFPMANAKSAVIKLPDLWPASGKKTTSDNQAMIRFLWGKVYNCGCWSSLNSERTSHPLSTICWIRARSHERKNRLNPPPSTAIVGILCSIDIRWHNWSTPIAKPDMVTNVWCLASENNLSKTSLAYSLWFLGQTMPRIGCCKRSLFPR